MISLIYCKYFHNWSLTLDEPSWEFKNSESHWFGIWINTIGAESYWSSGAAKSAVLLYQVHSMCKHLYPQLTCSFLSNFSSIPISFFIFSFFFFFSFFSLFLFFSSVHTNEKWLVSNCLISDYQECDRLITHLQSSNSF